MSLVQNDATLFTQTFLPYTRYFSRFPRVVSTFALHVESWGAFRRPHRGPSAFTLPLWPSLSNRKRLSFYSPRLPTIGRLSFPPMIENDLFSNDPRLSDSCLRPGSFSPRGVSHRPCSFGLNFIPPPSLYPPVAFFSSAKSVSRRHSLRMALLVRVLSPLVAF
ncbi:hypothetical protein TNCT_722391 [Trichonephila clavata]|uniref:Uncharacterized protein n=1 Tax=Trichonephila clavata TaxID=2740835 RepID=A0A8X6FJZ3_TRICU|nr:hypothetical protein TNCT_722391 [Trichonephila clavata]